MRSYSELAILLLLLLGVECHPLDSLISTLSTPSETVIYDNFYCESHTKKPCEDLPPFVIGVWPGPGTRVSSSYYKHGLDIVGARGLGVGAEISAISTDLDFFRAVVPVTDRTSLAVNDRELGKAKYIEDGLGLAAELNNLGTPTGIERASGPYWLSWQIPLDPGEHKAKLKIVRDDGKLLEYEWSFEVLPN